MPYDSRRSRRQRPCDAATFRRRQCNGCANANCSETAQRQINASRSTPTTVPPLKRLFEPTKVHVVRCTAFRRCERNKGSIRRECCHCNCADQSTNARSLASVRPYVHLNPQRYMLCVAPRFAEVRGDKRLHLRLMLSSQLCAGQSINARSSTSMSPYVHLNPQRYISETTDRFSFGAISPMHAHGVRLCWC